MPGAATRVLLATSIGHVLPTVARTATSLGLDVSSTPRLVEVLDGDVRERWAEMSVSSRREVIRALMSIAIHRTRRGARTLDPESITLTWR